MKTKVSGCIVTYNNSDIICECIETVLKNTQKVDFTLYVVDNASTDNTVELVRANFPQVEIIENTSNAGFGRGHNAVLDRLDSTYHAVINPDITLEGEVIYELCCYLEEHPQAAMITPQIRNEDGSEQYLPKYGPTIRFAILSKLKPFRYLRKIYTREQENISKPVETEFCTGCFFVIRTVQFQSLKGFDPRYFMYCEDADLSNRVRQSGKIIFYPQVYAVHKWKRDNTKSLGGILRFMNSLMKYFAKWGVKF